MKDWLSFDKMITPTIIKIIFWVGVAGAVLSGLISMVGGGWATLYGLFIIIIGPLIVRIYCELLIIMFKMYEALDDIRSNMQRNDQ